jgi:phosphoribosyl 1,2-cyclic phosphate phosphodiesterase
MPLTLTFLGTGTSAGVPMIGCRCEVCTSADPRDRRDRCSVLIDYPDTDEPQEQSRRFLVDTAPEMRLQMVRQGIDRLDGVFYTHAHADHLLGLDDLRRFNALMNAPLEIYAEEHTLGRIQAIFPYIFRPQTNINPKSWVAQLLSVPIEPGQASEHFGATWTPLRLMHGRMPVLGFRVDFDGAAIAYCTDVSTIPPETYRNLLDLDVLVIDALRYRHSPTHLSVDQALEVIERVEPKRAYFTHIAHDIKHAELEPRLPEGVFLAYDGLRVEAPTATADDQSTPRQAPLNQPAQSANEGPA